MRLGAMNLGAMAPRELGLAALGVAGLALLTAIGLEFAGPATPPPTGPAPAEAPPPLPAPPADAAGLVQTILARPLFAADRRPAATATATAASDELPRLAGIVIGPAGRRAIFQPGGDAKPLSLAEGGEIAGWRVRRIGADGVQLAGAKGERTLMPKPDPTLAAPPPGQGGLPGGLPGGPLNPRAPGLPPAAPFAGRPTTPAGPPAVPQPATRQPGGAPAAPNRR